MQDLPHTPDFCTDNELGYDRSRSIFKQAEAFRLDESYRLAHLPLVSPSHPDIIARAPGKSYDMGLHPRIHSLVMPLASMDLAGSASFLQMESELRGSGLAPKIAWDIVVRRQDKLHATIVGSLGEGEICPVLSPDALKALALLGPLRVRLRGLFSGNVNKGRLYLKAYPEKREGQNAFQLIQRSLGRPTTDLYVIGLYNFTDHLSPEEAAELAQIVERWWQNDLVDITVHDLWLMSSRDDLVLDSRIEKHISLLSL
jgi:hypothetical protein